MQIKYLLGRFLLKLPIIRYKCFVYRLLGVVEICGEDKKCHYFIGNPKVIGEYHNILVHNNSEIERNCFLLAKDKIEIEPIRIDSSCIILSSSSAVSIHI